MKGYLRNCVLSPKTTGESLFTLDKQGRTIASLDGYAIIPIEQYKTSTGTRIVSENPRETIWPCNACGATGPTPDGHDPCIANLPGVVHACCGHGEQAGYVMFADDRIIRGDFILSQPPFRVDG